MISLSALERWGGLKAASWGESRGEVYADFGHLGVCGRWCAAGNHKSDFKFDLSSGEAFCKQMFVAL